MCFGILALVLITISCSADNPNIEQSKDVTVSKEISKALNVNLIKSNIEIPEHTKLVNFTCDENCKTIAYTVGYSLKDAPYSIVVAYVFLSNDSGKTFTKVTSGIPEQVVEYDKSSNEYHPKYNIFAPNISKNGKYMALQLHHIVDNDYAYPELYFSDNNGKTFEKLDYSDNIKSKYNSKFVDYFSTSINESGNLLIQVDRSFPDKDYIVQREILYYNSKEKSYKQIEFDGFGKSLNGERINDSGLSDDEQIFFLYEKDNEDDEYDPKPLSFFAIAKDSSSSFVEYELEKQNYQCNFVEVTGVDSYVLCAESVVNKKGQFTKFEGDTVYHISGKKISNQKINFNVGHYSGGTDYIGVSNFNHNFSLSKTPLNLYLMNSKGLTFYNSTLSRIKSYKPTSKNKQDFKDVFTSDDGKEIVFFSQEYTGKKKTKTVISSKMYFSEDGGTTFKSTEIDKSIEKCIYASSNGNPNFAKTIVCMSEGGIWTNVV